MSTIARLRRWLEAVKATRGQCDAPGDTSIVVVSANGPPEARFCIFGGLIHCPHGAEDCCFCALRKQAMN